MFCFRRIVGFHINTTWRIFLLYINTLKIYFRGHSPNHSSTLRFKSLDLGSDSSAGYRGPILTEQWCVEGSVPFPELGLNRQRLIGGGQGSTLFIRERCHSRILEVEIRSLSSRPTWLSVLPYPAGSSTLSFIKYPT